MLALTHDPMVANSTPDELVRAVFADPQASARERALAEHAEQVSGLEAMLELSDSDKGDAENRAKELEEELAAERETSDAFRAMLRDVREQLHESQQEDIDTVLFEHPSEAEKAAREASRLERQRMWRLQSAYGSGTVRLMGQPAAFEYRGFRKKNWTRHAVVPALSEEALREMEKYRMQRGLAVREARWVAA